MNKNLVSDNAVDSYKKQKRQPSSIMQTSFQYLATVSLRNLIVSSAGFISTNFVAITVVAIGLSVGLMFAIRKGFGIQSLQSHHEVSDPLFACVGTLFAVLLGFMVANAMNRYDEARANMEHEAGTVRVDNFANVESWGNYAGPAFNPLLAFCREANVFDGQVQVFDTMFGANSMIESLPVPFCQDSLLLSCSPQSFYRLDKFFSGHLGEQ